MAPIPIDTQIQEILRENSPSTVEEIKTRIDPPRMISEVRARCVYLAQQGTIWSLGGDVYAESQGQTREDRILSILRREPQDLHGLVMTIWPTLDLKLRVAEVAIRFVQGGVDALHHGNKIQRQGKKWVAVAHG